MSAGKNPYFNSEGYADPTAYACIKAESELENRARLLVKTLKAIIRLCGFELVNRIEIKDKKSGRSFR